MRQLCLMTSSNPKVWDKERKLHFLGEWCKLYKFRKEWAPLDYLTVKPFSYEDALNQGFPRLTNSLTDKILSELSRTLNDFHNESLCSRGWSIVLGEWVRLYVEVMFNRWFTIKKAVEENNIGVTALLDEYTSRQGVVASDTLDFIWQCENDFWNYLICSKIIRKSQSHLESVVRLYPKKIPKTSNSETLYSKSIKRNIKNKISNVLALFARDNDAVIADSYLPLKDEITLNVALWQVPQIHVSSRTPMPGHDISLRNSISMRQTEHCKFSEFVLDNLMTNLPVCYLEGYSVLSKTAQDYYWPKKPKYIFTSNRYATDEVFKLKVAKKIRKGTKYFIGQHGNNSGIKKHISSEEEVLKVCDNFISWGWSDGGTKVIPTFVFKANVGDKVKAKPVGDLLLVITHQSQRQTAWDEWAEYSDYFSNVIKLIGYMSPEVRKHLIVRLHSAHQQTQWSEKERLRENFKDIRIDGGKTKLNRLLTSSRLVLFTYDSTGVVESFVRNYPVFCFWSEPYKYLKNFALPAYKKLEEVGILYQNPESAANKLNEIWSDIDGWWLAASVQQARLNFCKQFARSEANRIQKLKKVFDENSEVNLRANGSPVNMHSNI